MGWGLDVHWAALAREHGWRCGVVDAVSIRHRRRPRPTPTRARPRSRRRARSSRDRPYLSAREAGAPSRPIAAGERARPLHPKVAVVAEFYPSRRDPVLGIWAHRQALAARDAGAEVHVLVLHRLVPPRDSLGAGARWRAGALGARACASRAARHATGWESPTCRTCRPPRERPTPHGARGRRPRSRSRCARLARRSRSS